MRKTINFGKIDYNGTGKKNCAVTLEVEIRQRGGEKTFTIDPKTKERICTGETTPVYKELSICGNIWDPRHNDIYCGGQCLDTIAEYINTPLFEEIYKYWKLYHLNGMHPECEHQEALGWKEKATEKVKLYKFTLTAETLKEQNAIKSAVLEAAKNGEPLNLPEEKRLILALDYTHTSHAEELPGTIATYYKLRETETKTLGWLRENEHPEGILCKPCPVCGYKYGTAWKHREIPEDVLKRIEEIIKKEDAQ